MEKDSHSQLELFSQGNNVPAGKGAYSDRSFFINYIRAYEKTVLVIIGFITVAIIAFSLGVEKGKKVAAYQQPIAVLRQPAVAAQTPIVISQAPAVASQPPALIGAYTIQVASYLTKSMAQKEAAALKGKGHLTQLLTKGKYIVVCVGNFSNQNSAEPLLTELKKRYRDCRIRRL